MTTRRILFLFQLAFLVALTYGCVATRAPLEKAAIHIVLQPYFRGLRTVEVRIGGAPYQFLVDTAGGRTLVTPRLAAALGCTPRGRAIGYRMNGDPVEFQACPRLSGSISGYDLKLEPVASFDLASLLPAELPALDGVLALDAFRGQVVTFDWRKNELVVSGASVSRLPPRTVRLRFATGEYGGALSVLMPVAAGQDRLWFLLDSGDIRGTLLGRHVVRDQFLTLAADSTAILGIGDAAPEPLAVIVDDINVDGVLGTDYLQAHVITLDLRAAP